MLIIAARPHVIPFAAELAGFLDKGRGRLRETVEAVTVDSDNEEMKGLGVLHLAAGNGKLEMCRHLVEGLLMDVDILDSAGRSIPLSRQILAYQELWFYHFQKKQRKSYGSIHASSPGCSIDSTATRLTLW